MRAPPVLALGAVRRLAVGAQILSEIIRPYMPLATAWSSLCARDSAEHHLDTTIAPHWEQQTGIATVSSTSSRPCTAEKRRRPGFNRRTRLGGEEFDRRRSIDIVHELTLHIRAVTLPDLRPDRIEPEALGLLECIDQHQAI